MRELAGGITAVGFAGAVTTILAFIQVGISAKFLSAEDFGVFATVSAVTIMTSSIVTSPFPDYLVVKKDLTSLEYSSIFWACIVVSVAAVIVFIIIAEFAFADPPTSTRIFDLAALFMILQCAGVPLRARLQREKEFKALAWASFLSSLAGFSTVVFLLLRSPGLHVLFLGWLTAEIARVVILFHGNANLGLLPQLTFDWRRVLRALQIGKARAGSYLLNTFNERLDVLLVTFFFGASAAGNYFIAARLIKQPLSRLSPLIATISLPIFKDIANQPNRREHYYREALKLLSVIVIPVIIFLSLNLSIIVPLIIGDGWVLVPVIGSILSAMVISRLLVSMTGMMMLAKGEFTWVLKWQFITFLITTSVLLLAGTASLDITTFTISQCCAYGLACLLTFFSFQRVNRFRQPIAIVADLLTPLLFSGLSVVLGAFFANRISFSLDLTYLAFTFIFSAIIYLMLICKLSPSHFSVVCLFMAKNESVLRK